MKKLMIILILMIVPIKSFAWKPDRWTVQDSVLQGSYGLLFMTDGMLTSYALKKYKIKELNFILGENPSTKKICIYNTLFFTGHTIITYLIPSTIKIKNYYFHPRTVWQSIWIGTEITAIYAYITIYAKHEF